MLLFCGVGVSPCLLSVWRFAVSSGSFVGGVRSVFCQNRGFLGQPENRNAEIRVLSGVSCLYLSCVKVAI